MVPLLVELLWLPELTLLEELLVFLLMLAEFVCSGSVSVGSVAAGGSVGSPSVGLSGSTGMYTTTPSPAPTASSGM